MLANRPNLRAGTFHLGEIMEKNERREAAKDKMIVALDTSDADKATDLVQQLKNHVRCFKAGLTLVSALGTQRAIEIAKNAGRSKVFLDMKLHDIPEQIGGAVTAACQNGVSLMTLHASGGASMLDSARKARDGWHLQNENKPRPLLFAVTVLTSIDFKTGVDIGIYPAIALNIHDDAERANTQGMYRDEHVLRLARIAVNCGIDGVVCSPQELPRLRRSFTSKDLLTLTPGIRPAGSAANDQKRTGTPASAIADGSDILVIGRPITEAEDPVAAADRILDEIEAATPH